MTTYTCKECGGVSHTPGVCQTEGCGMHGQPLTPHEEGDHEKDEEISTESENGAE